MIYVISADATAFGWGGVDLTTNRPVMTGRRRAYLDRQGGYAEPVESMEAALAEPHTGRISGPEFRAFQASRPDHERWELLGGVAMMMTPPTLTHNQIATNLQRLLDAALERHDPSLLAAQRPCLELGSRDYKPEPDIGVIDADFSAGQRFVETAYLLAEIVSESDDAAVPGTDRRWVDWQSAVLEGGDAELTIPSFGFRCSVADLYDKTPLQPRRVSRR